jgi:hypothetical protein
MISNRQVGFLLLHVPWGIAVWFGAVILDSYRYEPSGVQYAFLPAIAAPFCAVAAFAVALSGRAWLRLPLPLLMLLFLPPLIFLAPAVGLPLTNYVLRAAFWTTLLAAGGYLVSLGLRLPGLVRARPS